LGKHKKEKEDYMATIEVRNITKKFGPQRAVDGVSFDVDRGEIFGLLGPNGAGKTTAIRILLDIYKPDSGTVAILGGPMNEKKKDHVGYLPEERGLYQDIQLDRCLVYLATLKGLAEPEARKRVKTWMERFDLSSHSRKKMKELSKGMQQKAQLIATLIHEPEVVIIDEPFSALDPVNTQMVKDILRELRSQNRTIVMCTHQMHQVEELCDRLVLIDQGKSMLYGRLEDIQREFSGHDVILKTTAEIDFLPGVTHMEKYNSSGYRVGLPAGVTVQEFLRQVINQGVALDGFEVALPTLDEIFIQVVQNQKPAGMDV
jgi:ABC-2 type transport system ATP-binding protein